MAFMMVLVVQLEEEINEIWAVIVSFQGIIFAQIFRKGFSFAYQVSLLDQVCPLGNYPNLDEELISLEYYRR
jgi:hypothetical protein